MKPPTNSHCFACILLSLLLTFYPALAMRNILPPIIQYRNHNAFFEITWKEVYTSLQNDHCINGFARLMAQLSLLPVYGCVDPCHKLLAFNDSLYLCFDVVNI